MNGKTMALAIGVAGVLLVAGLATMFSSTSFSDLWKQKQEVKDDADGEQSGDDSGSSSGGSDANAGSDQTTSSGASVPDPEPEPIPVQGEPKLNVAYATGTYGNEVYYGMPSARSGPYPGWDYQYPGANEFMIETNGYGPDQPDGPTNIALFIQIGGIGSRWVGSNEIPEGTVEVRTFPESAMTPRLVNLFNDGSGNCKGILVNAWDVYDHSFIYEHGVTDNNKLTFSLDITKLGDYKVSVWAIHDHGGGKAVQVSNMLSWTVHVIGANICTGSISPYSLQYTSGVSNQYRFDVTRSTEPDDDNRNLYNTVAFTGSVKNVLRIEGTTGYSVSINGVALTGRTIDGWGEYDLGSFDFSSQTGGSYSASITFTDGGSHSIQLVTYDLDTGQLVGSASGYAYVPMY